MEPTYEKETDTLDAILDTDLDWGNHARNNFAIPTVTSPELVTFLENKVLKKAAVMSGNVLKEL